MLSAPPPSSASPPEAPPLAPASSSNASPFFGNPCAPPKPYGRAAAEYRHCLGGMGSVRPSLTLADPGSAPFSADPVRPQSEPTDERDHPPSLPLRHRRPGAAAGDRGQPDPGRRAR